MAGENLTRALEHLRAARAILPDRPTPRVIADKAEHALEVNDLIAHLDAALGLLTVLQGQGPSIRVALPHRAGSWDSYLDGLTS